jgi:hypothetical protein
MIVTRKIYTTDPDFRWSASFDRINAIQRLAKGLTHGRTSIEYIDLDRILTAKHKSGRTMVDWSWFQKNLTDTAIKEGFNCVGFHIRSAARAKFRLSGTIRGAHVSDKDAVNEYYVIADTREQFERRLLHEEGHEYEPYFTEERDNPLHYYVLNDDIEGFYRRVDTTKYPPFIISPTLINKLKAALQWLMAYNAQQKERTLVSVATKYLGTDASPLDRAPDFLGCAETVSAILHDFENGDFDITTWTPTLLANLEAHPMYERTDEVAPGVIGVVATEPDKPFPGHCWIFMEDFMGASNDSDSGKFEKNYTQDQIRRKWVSQGGYALHLFRRKVGAV